jgi:hypothetical protein
MIGELLPPYCTRGTARHRRIGSESPARKFSLVNRVRPFIGAYFVSVLMDYIPNGVEAKGERESEAHSTMDNFRAYPRQGERQTLNG